MIEVCWKQTEGQKRMRTENVDERYEGKGLWRVKRMIERKFD